MQNKKNESGAATNLYNATTDASAKASQQTAKRSEVEGTITRAIKEAKSVFSQYSVYSRGGGYQGL